MLFDRAERGGIARVDEGVPVSGEICGMRDPGFAMASPDAANAPANPVGLRFGDFGGLPLLVADSAEAGGEKKLLLSLSDLSLLTDPRRHGRRFFEVELTELIDATSELSLTERKVELERRGIVALEFKATPLGGVNSLTLWECIPVGDSMIIPSSSA